MMNLDGRIDFQSQPPDRALPKCFLMMAKWASSGLSPQKHDPAFYTDKYYFKSLVGSPGYGNYSNLIL